MRSVTVVRPCRAQRKGRKQRRVPRRLRVVLDLEHAEPGAGLANQLYGLVRTTVEIQLLNRISD